MIKTVQADDKFGQQGIFRDIFFPLDINKVTSYNAHWQARIPAYPTLRELTMHSVVEANTYHNLLIRTVIRI